MRNFAITMGLVSLTTLLAAASSVPLAAQPVELRVDNLVAPLGIDDATPQFSWQLHDTARGARQTAFEILVASNAQVLKGASAKADVWDSGRIDSSQSLNIRYAGPALRPSTRYFWCVRLWGASGTPYPASDIAWWETGLLSQGGWKAAWVGYETPEEAAVRHAEAQWIADPEYKTLAAEKSDKQRYAFRKVIVLAKPIRNAALFATGEDTVSAWLNGTQVLSADPLPPYKQMPWKKFVRVDATRRLVEGSNTVAVELLHYVANPNGMAIETAPPLMATLYVEYTDGTLSTFSTSLDWKTAIHPAAGWQETSFNDSEWRPAIPGEQAPGAAGAQPLGNPWIPDSVKALRRSFSLDSPVKSARLYATALGAYEFFLNGKRVGWALLAPGWTDFRQRAFYQSYDVTPLLNNGSNVAAALLAPGWYSTSLEWYQQPNNYGDTPPALRAQLRIEHTDGKVEWIATDSSWRASTSHILSAEIYDGETQDRRLIKPEWDTPAFVASDWSAVNPVDPKPIALQAQNFPPIRVERAVPAKSVNEPKPGVYVYDLGQNLSGVERIKVQGAAGAVVRVRFAEVLNPDGTIYTDNLRTAKATDHFTLNGEGVEELTPQFTFHGFRYIEITGLPKAPPQENVAALVIHTDAPFTAKLSTGNSLVNQLWSNVQWGQRSNFVGVPTDCPQRDERLGWMADAQVFWRAASYNMDLAAFSRKFAADMRGTQATTPFFGIYAPGTWAPTTGFGSGWSDAGVVIPWTSWLQTGDTSVIEENWAAMERYLAAIQAANPGWLWEHENGIPFGDWLSPEGKTDNVLISTAYWAYDVTLMKQMAHATGRTGDEDKYASQFAKIRAAFEAKFVRDDGSVAGADNSPSPFGDINNPNAKSKGGDTQAGYVLALHMNLLPENLRPAAAKKLADKIWANNGLLGTGFLGTPYLLQELTKAGYTQLAYKLLLNTEYPSWGYPIKHGATTIWERWNGDQMISDPSMNSFNHYAYGAVADWIYSYAGGIDATPAAAGYHTVVLHPVFDSRLGNLRFDYDSQYGPIHSDWVVTNKTAEWHLTLPANTVGQFDMTAEDAAHYKIDGKPVTDSATIRAGNHGRSIYELPAGSYNITVDLAR